MTDDKDVVFIGSSLTDLRAFPKSRVAMRGYQSDITKIKVTIMKQQRYKNVFEALEDDAALAENLKIRSQLMNFLSQYINQEGLTQKQAAELFDVKQPRISDLMCGKIERFTIDMLITMLARTGKHVQLKVSSRTA